MALAFEDRTVRRITADEVMRMVDAGVLEDPRRFELLDGILVDVTIGPEHMGLATRLLRWLAGGMATQRFDVRMGGPLAVPDPYWLPEPDVSVVVPRDYGRQHPTTALLAIEIAVSSLRTDLKVKTGAYALAAVEEYWVIDVKGHRLHVFTHPTPGGYAQHTERAAEGTITPKAVEVEPLDLAALLADFD